MKSIGSFFILQVPAHLPNVVTGGDGRLIGTAIDQTKVWKGLFGKCILDKIFLQFDFVHDDNQIFVFSRTSLFLCCLPI